MPMSRLGAEARNQIAENGHAMVPSCLDAPTVCELSDSSMQDTQESAICGGLMEPVLGSNCFAVDGIFFNKGDGANWKVACFTLSASSSLGCKIAAVLNQRGDSDVPCTELTVCFT